MIACKCDLLSLGGGVSVASSASLFIWSLNEDAAVNKGKSSVFISLLGGILVDNDLLIFTLLGVCFAGICSLE